MSAQKIRTIRTYDRVTGAVGTARYESRQIPTADLKIGDVITAPGVGLWVRLRKVEHRPNGITEITYAYEVAARPRQAVRQRKTAGKTTVHVRLDAQGG